VVITGATLWLFTSAPVSIGDRGEKQAGAQPRTLNVDQTARPIEAAAPAGDSPVVQAAGTRSGSSVQPLPAADASGTVVLTPGATYLAKDLQHTGALVIRAAEGGPARLIVRDTAWQLSGDSIRVENVQLEFHAPVQWQCRGLDLVRSVIVAGAGSSASAIQWRPQDSAAVSPGTITITDSHLVGSGLQSVSRPSMIRITNCLKTGSGPFLQIAAAGRAHQALQVQVTRTTLRESGPLIAWTPGPRAAGQRIEVVTKACVFAPAAGTPLLALAGSIAPSEWERSIGISGLESLLRIGTKVVDLVPPPGKPRGAIDASKLEVDGLLTATIEFFGAGSDDAASCGLKSTDALFSVDQPPGVQVDKVGTRMAAMR
jgi:hypothetical protein